MYRVERVTKEMHSRGFVDEQVIAMFQKTLGQDVQARKPAPLPVRKPQDLPPRREDSKTESQPPGVPPRRDEKRDEPREMGFRREQTADYPRQETKPSGHQKMVSAPIPVATIDSKYVAPGTQVQVDQKKALGLGVTAITSGAASDLAKGASIKNGPNGPQIALKPTAVLSAGSKMIKHGGADIISAVSISSEQKPADKPNTIEKKPSNLGTGQPWGHFRPPPLPGQSAQVFFAPPPPSFVRTEKPVEKPAEKVDEKPPAPPQSTKPVKPALPSKQKRVTAIEDFIAQEPTDLGLKKGQVAIVTKQVDENWYFGTSEGKEGIFPVSFVEPI